jgi:hypothetical protein
MVFIDLQQPDGWNLELDPPDFPLDRKRLEIVQAMK